MKVNEIKDVRRYCGVLLLTAFLFFFAVHLAVAANAPESAADFIALKGEKFSVIRVGKGSQAWSKTVELRLIEISILSQTGPTEQFSVRFQGPKQTVLDKAVYRFENIKTGQFSLFLEPAKPDSKLRYYQATFNLLKKNI